MHNKLLLTITFAITSFIWCKGQSCDSLTQKFHSYEEAIKQIRNTTYRISDRVNTSKSSWIRNAQYYSCDGRIGYFILSTSSKEYVHERVSIELWEKFKVARSFGAFYNQHIKNRYQLKLR